MIGARVARICSCSGSGEVIILYINALISTVNYYIDTPDNSRRHDQLLKLSDQQ